MDKILFGDNQFFAVNHASDEKARAQSIRFKEDKAIIKVLDQAIDLGINNIFREISLEPLQKGEWP